eukprot:gene25524-28844_t
MKAASATSLALAGGVPALASATTAIDPWERAADIVKRLSKPQVFRKQDFDVTKYGAAPCKVVKVKAWKSFEEQEEMNTPAPSNQPSDYAKYGDFDCGKNGKLVISRWQSNDCLNFSSPIYAYGQDNI